MKFELQFPLHMNNKCSRPQIKYPCSNVNLIEAGKMDRPLHTSFPLYIYDPSFKSVNKLCACADLHAILVVCVSAQATKSVRQIVDL